jgi:ubiquinone/menaquinone biosynthesis C-methylase UbiE
MIFNLQDLIEKIGVEKGMVVADFGIGGGHLAIELAKKVEENGKVFAVDVVSRKLELFQSLARANDVFNVEIRRANLEKSSLLESDLCDRITATNLFLQIDKDKWEILLKDIKRVLKQEGKAVIVDWKPESDLGPPKEQRISFKEIEPVIKKVFGKYEEIKVGDNHWGVIIEKK